MSVSHQSEQGPTLRIDPTARCNVPGRRGFTASAAPQDELPRELIHAALKDAAQVGYEHLVVGGGEPFLFDGLPGVLARARRLDYVVTVETNGMLIGQTRRWAPVAPLIDSVLVPIHGPAAQHDRLQRREGSYAQSVANLAILRGSGVPFGLVFTLTAGNAELLDHVVRLAATEGAANLELRALPGAGADAEGAGDGSPSGAQFAEALTWARRLGRDLGVRVDADVVTADELVLYRGRFVPQFPTREVAALAPVLVVEASGIVRPLCHAIPDRLMVGSLHHHRLGAMVGPWMASRRAADLVTACDRTWWALAEPGALRAAHWPEQVAARLAALEAEAALPLAVAA